MAPKLAGDIYAKEDDLQSTPININTAGSNTIIAGVSGDTIQVYRALLVATAANTITFLDGSNPLSGPVSLAAAQGLFFRFDTKTWFETQAGNSFNINLLSATQVSGVLYYTMSNTGGGAAPVPSPTPDNGYIIEDGTAFYVAEDGVTFYVQES